MSYHLDFLNKNMYRKFPLRATSTHVFEDGLELPQGIIVSLQISAPYAYSALYVAKVYVNANFVNLSIRNYADNGVVGFFAATLTQDFQVITMESAVSTISGTLTVGTRAAVNSLTPGMHHLSPDNGRIEDSVIFCYTPPAVTKLIHGDKSVTGLVDLVTENITIETATESIELAVIDIALIASNNNFNGSLDNCLTPLIKKINTVEPDENGNIDIYGILPVTIDVGTEEIELDTTVTIDEVCPERTKIYPPTNNTDVYYTDILTATQPEWRTWPQFS